MALQLRRRPRAVPGGAPALRTAAAWLLLAGIVSCDLTVTPPPEMRRPMEPLPIYPEWFVETEACSGLDGDYDLIQWFTADHIILEGGNQLRGQWWWPHDIIIRNGLQDDDFLVRHEMLHDLIQGDAGHTRAEWKSCELHPDDE